jgi:hypothetical protein
MKLAIAVSPERITRSLILITLILSGLSLLSQWVKYGLGYGRLVGMFDVNGERNLPASYSAALLLACAILLAVIAVIKMEDKARYINHWRGLSAIFLFLSLDELISLHERTILPLRTALQARSFLYSTWVVLGAGFVGLILLFYFKFLLHLPSRTRRILLLAAGLYIGGALGVELLHGHYLDFYGRDLIYALIAAVEELLEMLGIITFIYGLLTYIRSLRQTLAVNFIPKSDQPQATSLKQ